MRVLNSLAFELGRARATLLHWLDRGDVVAEAKRWTLALGLCGAMGGTCHFADGSAFLATLCCLGTADYGREVVFASRVAGCVVLAGWVCGLLFSWWQLVPGLLGMGAGLLFLSAGARCKYLRHESLWWLARLNSADHRSVRDGDPVPLEWVVTETYGSVLVFLVGDVNRHFCAAVDRGDLALARAYVESLPWCSLDRASFAVRRQTWDLPTDACRVRGHPGRAQRVRRLLALGLEPPAVDERRGLKRCQHCQKTGRLLAVSETRWGRKAVAIHKSTVLASILVHARLPRDLAQMVSSFALSF